MSACKTCNGRGAVCGCGGAYDERETDTGAHIPATCDCADLRGCEDAAHGTTQPATRTGEG